MGKVTYRMLGIAVTFIVCLVFRVSAAIRPGLPACIVVLFFGTHPPIPWDLGQQINFTSSLTTNNIGCSQGEASELEL